MSVKIMGLVWDCELPRNEKYVLLALADHADHEGCNIYPSVGRVAWKTGYDERMVQRIIKELINKGILIPNGQGKRGTNQYRIELNCLPEREDYHPRQNATPGKMPPNDVQNVTPTPGKMPPESSSKRHINRKYSLQEFEPSEFTDELLKLCQIRFKAITKNQKKILVTSLEILKDIQATTEQLRQFTLFWQSNWRSKSGSPPTLNQVCELWGEFEAWAKKKSNTTNGAIVKEGGGYYL